MELKRQVQTEVTRGKITRLLVELERAYHDQMLYWQQKGMAAWMKDGDKNTSYFHVRATT